MSKQRVEMLSTEFQPIGKNILVDPIGLKKEETTAGGIILKVQETALTRPFQGTVIEVGEEIQGIEPGDFVMWPDTDGIDFEFDDGEKVLIRLQSVLGIKK